MDTAIPGMDTAVPGIAGELGLFAAAVACGLLIRIILGYAGQDWAKTYSNTVTYLLLPAVGLVIVQVISNSIALSLGMIGALSIVRFRHPVKSPLELVVYFLLLTIGVALSTRPNLALLLTALAALLIVGTMWYQRLWSRRGLAAFPMSPADGDRSYLLEITSDSPIESIAGSDDLVFSHEDRDAGIYTYKMAFASRAIMRVWQDRLRADDSVTRIAGSYR